MFRTRSASILTSYISKVFRQVEQRHSYASISTNTAKTDSAVAVTTGTASADLSDESTLIRSDRGPLPIITSRQLEYCPTHRIPRQAWVENLDTIEEEKLGLVDLHPDIFAHFPRMDILQENIRWQSMYKRIDWHTVKTRAELPGGGRKPWPQKGTGRARHGSVRSPLFLHGGKAHGPRGPKTHFNMISFFTRVKGLCIALSMKFAQDDLKIVDSLEIPSEDPEFLEDLAAQRSWGISVLFVDDTDMMPKNISLATEVVGHINLMPVYGLNCFSMLKHETLVLTTAAVNRIEERLLFQLHRSDAHGMIQKSANPTQGSAYRPKTPSTAQSSQR